MPLSDTRLRSLVGKPYEGKPELADRDGLSARISKNGAITGQYRFRWERKAARISMGRYPDLTVKEARELIPDIRNILAEGLDPRLCWRPNSSNHHIITAAHCVEQFMSIRAPKLKDKMQTLYKSVLNKYYIHFFRAGKLTRSL